MDEYSNKWSKLVYKGYQGALEKVRAIIPERNAPPGNLSNDDQRRNHRIAHERIIVECFWKILHTLGCNELKMEMG